MLYKNYDVVIVGLGASALTLANKLLTYGLKVALIGLPFTSTSLAQGGIALSFGEDIEKHIQDTVKASDGLYSKKVVRNIISTSEEVYEFLTKIGVRFDEKRRKEAAHSSNRIFACKDKTGFVIQSKLWQSIRGKVDIFIGQIHALCKYTKTIFTDSVNIKFKVLILATGGINALFSKTTNYSINIGKLFVPFLNDITFSNLEFIQFHPTALDIEADRLPLLTEALRGHGAKLVNSDGKYFIDPLLPRYIVAKAINKEYFEGREVFLELKDLDLKNDFPQVYEILLKNNLITENENTVEKVKVTTAAHYSCGGVVVNEYFQTDVDWLFVIGEAACTYFHGANRLASNSLLEAVYSGLKLAKYLKKNIDVFEFFEKGLTNPIYTNLSISYEERKLLTFVWYNLNQENIIGAINKVNYPVSRLLLKFALRRLETRGVFVRNDFNFKWDVNNSFCFKSGRWHVYEPK